MAKREMEMEKSSKVELGDTMEKELKQYKNGGIFPVKRRLVKKMMFDYIFHKLVSVFCSSSEIVSEPKASRGKMKIHPNPTPK